MTVSTYFVTITVLFKMENKPGFGNNAVLAWDRNKLTIKMVSSEIFQSSGGP